jgi:hypothetical protein
VSFLSIIVMENRPRGNAGVLVFSLFLLACSLYILFRTLYVAAFVSRTIFADRKHLPPNERWYWICNFDDLSIGRMVFQLFTFDWPFPRYDKRVDYYKLYTSRNGVPDVYKT